MKLAFYNTIKKSFGYEQFLNMNLSYNESKKLTQFRSSSHQFNIETGRHGTHKRNQVVPRVCNACSTDETDVLDNFAEMPFFDPIIKDDGLSLTISCLILLIITAVRYLADNTVIGVV